MDLLELHCKHCGAPIQQEDIDDDRGLVKCAYCGAVFGLPASLSRGTRERDGIYTSLKQHRRTPVPMPSGIEVLDMGNALQISYKWFNPTFLFLLFFCVFWDGFMIVWHGISLASGAWFMSLFGLLHTAVGIGLSYYTLAGFINRTTVNAGQGMLQIWHHPLPWWGNKQLMTHEVKQVYCRERVSHSDNGTSYSYEVNAVFQDSRKETLLRNLAEPEQALYVEQTLEHYLGIQDHPVRGELPR